MSATTPPPLLVLVVDEDDRERDHLRADLEAVLGTTAAVRTAAGADDAEVEVNRAQAEGALIALVLVDQDLLASAATDLLSRLRTGSSPNATRLVLITDEPSLHAVEPALTHPFVQGLLNRPWSASGLRSMLAAHLLPHLAGRPQLAERLDHRERARPAPSVAGVALDPATLLLDHTLDESEVERLMVEVLDEALGRPPRLRLAPGTVLLEEGEHVGGIYVVLEGEVALSRVIDGRVHLQHSRSTGPIVGLLSLTGHERSFHHTETVTDALVIPLTVEQLGHAISSDGRLAALLTRVLVSSLARRLRRADELQLEIEQLNRALAAERDELAQALRALAEADAQLVSQARLATLGELAAGVAHELNNPSAALRRASEHLAEDLAVLVPPDSPAGRALEAARTEPPMSSATARAGRRALADDLAAAGLGDRAVADRLWAAGIRDLETARSVLGLGPAHGSRSGDGSSPLDGARFEAIEAGARAGTALRGIHQATERIAGLVDGLRAYLRGGSADEPFSEVDVVEGVEDALRLLGHRLGGATVERRYDAVPRITGRPGSLQQVWTNLVANALEAGGPEVKITLEVTEAQSPTGAPAVAVTVTDDGPGIPADLAQRIFEPRFTTKHGTVTFGVGLGLSISRKVVEAHGGTISVASRPGRTVFTVVLPVTPPAGAHP